MTDRTKQHIDEFLNGSPHAVVGASTDRSKYGNKVFRCYLQNHRQAFPIHPRAKEVEGFPAYPDLASVPVPVHGVSIITPPDVTESVVEQAAKAGIKHLWMQPGAESAEAIAKAVDSGMNVIHSGPCLLVLLGYRERAQ